MAKIWAIMTLLLFMSIASSFGDKEEEARRLLAETYMASGQQDKAVEVYSEIVARHPFDVKARISLAEVLSWTGDYDGALEEYGRVLEIDPENTEALSKMAEVYYWKGDLARAESSYRELLGIDPGRRDAHASLGEILTWQKKYPEAIEAFSRAMEDSGTAQEKVMYGRALLYSGQYDMSEVVFKEVLEEDPGNTEAMVYLADTYAYGKQFDKGIDLYEKALTSKDDIFIKEKLADTLSWDRQYERSFKMYDEILEESYDPKVHRQKARVLGWARRYKQSEAEYRKAIETRYDENTEMEMEAKLSYWNGRVRGAIKRYNELIAREPENVEAMFDLSQVYSYESMWQKAMAEYKRILGIMPAHFRASEGLEKVRLISGHVPFSAFYRYFEADSQERETDIRKHQMLTDMVVPLNSRTFVEIGYALAGRMFSDFHDIVENEGKVKLTYLAKPDWQVSAYYGLIGYNRGIDEFTHLFGADMGVRVMDLGIYSVYYDRERLENNSNVIRNHYYRHKVTNRLDLDITMRLKAGLEYTYARYSDSNYLNEPGCDILYYISLDPRRLALKYRYTYKEYSDKVFEYFSPKGFSTSTITLNWRHYLNKEEIFFGANDIYYDLSYDVSIDSTNIVGNSFSWEINYDITKRMNLNFGGSITASSAGVYKESEFRGGMKYYF